MATNEDGGQAFPGVWPDRQHAGGMSLRDYFAAQAMAAIVSNDVRPYDPDGSTATKAYAFADAMLEARKRCVDLS